MGLHWVSEGEVYIGGFVLGEWGRGRGLHRWVCIG